jgi:protocatechuate 3,4-dioxygenase beta subunit
MRPTGTIALALSMGCLIGLTAVSAYAVVAPSSSAQLSGYVFLDGSGPSGIPNGMWDSGETGFAGVSLYLRLYYRQVPDGPVLSYDWGASVATRRTKTDANGYYKMTVDTLATVATMYSNGALRFPFPLYYELYIPDDGGHGLIGGGSPYYCTTDLTDGFGSFLSKHGTDASRAAYKNVLLPIPGSTDPVFNWPVGSFPNYSTFMGTPGDWSADEIAEFQRKYMPDPYIAGVQVPNIRNHIDFGFWRPAVAAVSGIGDYVWEDLDHDGIQDPGEPGVAGATVRLYDAAGTQVGVTTTGSDGRYLFDGLYPGDYHVAFTPPGHFMITLPNQGGDDAADSDADPVTGVCATTTLEPDETDRTWDCGLYRLAGIGDTVWHDANANGIQDSGELGIPGVPVELLDAGGTVVATTVTGAGGLYRFDGLIPGTYSVHFLPPAGWTVTAKDQGSDDTHDSDADAISGRTVNVLLPSNVFDPTWDCGLYQPAAIGDFVWDDKDADGIQDSDEAGIAGVTVNLISADGNVLQTTTTGTTGFYLFEGLRPGYYAVKFVAPAGYTISPQDQGGDDAADSDAAPTGMTAFTDLSAGEKDLTWDCGLYRPAAIGDFVWDDKDADGIQDSDEVGIAGVTVNLLDATGAVVDTTSTDPTGYYLFSDLMPGRYAVQFVAPTGYFVSPQDQGADDAADSDADRTTATTAFTELSEGEEDLTWDCGLYKLAALGDFVWRDTDRDGVQDDGEAGVQGVVVKLISATGAAVATATTDADGYYLFDRLTPGTYAVQFLPPTQYLVSPQGQGSDNAADSDADQATGKTVSTVLESGETDLTWDCGLYDYPQDIKIAKSGSKLYGDTRTPGFWKNNISKAISGKSGWQVSKSTLLALLRQIQAFYLPDPFQFGTSDSEILSNAYDVLAYGGSNTALKLRKDLLCCELNLFSGTYALSDTAGQDGLCRYAEDVLNGAAGDMGALHTYIDWLNNAESRPQTSSLSVGDGIVYTITLTADSFAPRTVTVRDYLDPSLSVVAVDGGGVYNAAGGYVEWTVNLPAGPATVSLHVWVQLESTPRNTEGPNPGAGWSASNVVTMSAAGCSYWGVSAASSPDKCTTTTGGTLKNKAWFTGGGGGEEKCAIGDLVWKDLDHDGIQDTGEPGVANVTVALKQAGNTVATQQTGADGKYIFSGLTPGDYSLTFTLPAGYQWTVKDQGSDDAADSDTDSAGSTATTTLSAGETDLTWDAGIWLAPAESVTIAKTGVKMAGNCKTIGFWKNNIGKALAGKATGTQVSKSDLVAWLKAVRGVYRDDPYKNLLPTTSDTALLQAAYTILNDGGSSMTAKTLQQLLACELNYVSSCFAMQDTGAHLLLIKQAEDLLNTSGADLSAIHTLLDQANNLGNTSQDASISAGDTLVYTITIKSSLNAPRPVEVRDYLDSALSLVYADSGGVLVSGRYVSWALTLPAGANQVTKLQVTVKLNSSPRGDAGANPGTGWICSGWCALSISSYSRTAADADKCTGTVTGGTLYNRACIKLQ